MISAEKTAIWVPGRRDRFLMSNREFRVLKYLRIYGPCSVADLHKRIPDMKRANVYRCLYNLRQKFYVEHLELGRYDVSAYGRRYVNSRINQPLLKRAGERDR